VSFNKKVLGCYMVIFKRKLFLIFILTMILFGGLSLNLQAQSLREYYIGGMNAYKADRYQDAFEIWLVGLKKAEKINDLAWQGAFNPNIGSLFDRLGQYEKALSYYQQAAGFSKKIGDHIGEGQTLGNIGVVYKKTGRYDLAITHYNKALRIFRKIGERLGESIILRNIGLVQLNLGGYDQALSNFQKALVIAKDIGNRRWETKNLVNIGTVYKNLGQYNKALAYQRNALKITKQIGDRNQEGNALGNIGLLYDYLGRYDEALFYYKRTLEIAREIGDRRDEGTALNNIGVVYDILGQYEQSSDYYEQALFIKKKIGDRQGEGGALLNIGVVRRHLHQTDLELSYYQKALIIFKQIGDRRSQIVGLSNIGMVYEGLGQHDTALSYYQEALAIAKKLGDRLGEGDSYFSIGSVYLKLGRFEKAHQSFSDSFKICNDVGALESIWRAQVGLGRTEAKMRKYDSAVSHYENTLQIIEAMRTELVRKEVKISFMRGRLFVYDEYIELLQTLHQKFPDKGYDRKSFEIFERKQGRVFLEEMGKSGARNFAGLPDAVRKKEIELENQMAKTKAELVSERTKPLNSRSTKRIKNLEGRIDKIKSGQQVLEKEIQSRYPDYYNLKYPLPVKLSVLQKQVLKSGEMMVVYGVIKNNTSLWVIGEDRFGLFLIAEGGAALEEKVDAFRKGPESVIKAIQKGSSPRLERALNRSQRRINRAAQDLYQTLLPDQARKMIAGAKTLYIIPTGPLYGLPFEALVSQIDSNQASRYLIKDHAVVYLSSASLLKTLREAQTRRKETPKYPLLAFAHPVYKESAQDPDLKKKCLQTKGISVVACLRSGAFLGLMGGAFPELPETEAEAREIKATLKAPEASSPLQLRQNASRSTVLALNKSGKLDDYRYVVFSCHGILPGEINRITQPALVLSHPDPRSKTDGFLTMTDVFGIKLNADMVTLSACNTGRGKAEKGEGVRGLTRAFMYAGTQAISVTLWSVESQSAKQLSTGLYRNLKQGKNRAEALRQIKLRMINGKEGALFQHPFFWAPVVIFGDGGGGIQ